MWVFCGTPEEFERVAHLFAAPQTTPAGNNVAPNGVTVSADTIVKALRYRNGLGGPHEALVEAVVAAHPGSITAQQLQSHVSADIGVVLGNIGRRLIAVGVPDRKASGKRPSRSIIFNESDPKTGEATYQASEQLVEAWRRIKEGKN